MKKDIVKEEFKQLLKDIRKYDVLTKEEEQKLFIAYNNGDKTARQKLINSNLRLVASNAFVHSVDDNERFVLFQEGVFGLIKAIEKFDISLDLKFSTYATPWIKQSMQRYMLNNNYKKIPEWMCILSKNIINYSNYYYSINGIYPTNEELSEHLKTPINNIITAKNVCTLPISINTPQNINSDDSSIFLDIPDYISVEKEATNNILKQELMQLLDNTLTELEKKIIIKRFGLNDNKYSSIKEIAKDINLNYNKVFTEEQNALRKIRKSDIKRFKDYL